MLWFTRTVTRCGWFLFCSGASGGLLLTPLSGGPLSLQLPSLKQSTCFFLENANAVAKRCSGAREDLQGRVRVHAEFCETMPVRQIEEKRHKACIVGFWEKPFENRYCDLVVVKLATGKSA
jgi:hypothetical protein